MTATGCSITSAATVSTTGTAGCFTFRAAFFAGAGLGLDLATVRFVAFAILDALLGLPRLAEFALRSLARPCTFGRFLRLAMMDAPGLVRARQLALMPNPQVPATDRGSYQQIAA